MYEILISLHIGNLLVTGNDLCILGGKFAICGVPERKFCTICSSVDKLNKESWRKRMMEEKGLPTEAADVTGDCLQNTGEICSRILHHPQTSRDSREDWKLLFEYLILFNTNDQNSFNLSPAWELAYLHTYYTRFIYEAVLPQTPTHTWEEPLGGDSITVWLLECVKTG